MLADCIHFTGNRPCSFHKEIKTTCESCKEYVAIKKRILVIKLGAMGDVLRTTAILRQLKDSENTYITWITRHECIDLIKNEYINEILDFTISHLTAMLKVEEFDEVYSLDNDKESAVFAELAQANHKFGFGLDKHGFIFGYTEAAQKWLEVSVNDNLKKANKKSYQQVLFEMCNLEFDPFKDKMVLPLDWRKTNILHVENSINVDDDVWGIVLGAGERWKNKGLSKDKIFELVGLLQRNNKKIIFIGGKQEATLMENFSEMFLDVINSGSKNSVKKLIKIINLCRVLITPDSLSMHIGIALEKTVYAYIGPTSSAELEDYSVLKKLVPDIDCVGCYLVDCAKEKKCNELVKFDQIIKDQDLVQ